MLQSRIEAFNDHLAMINCGRCLDVFLLKTYQMGLHVRKPVFGVCKQKVVIHSANLHILISAFVIRLLESIISGLALLRAKFKFYS